MKISWQEADSSGKTIAVVGHWCVSVRPHKGKWRASASEVNGDGPPIVRDFEANNISAAQFGAARFLVDLMKMRIADALEVIELLGEN